MNKTEKKQCVLVVDDQSKVLKFIEIYLKLRGFKVITTTSGEEALELVKSECPDIMLLDVIMPGIDGIGVMEKLRTFSELPVIVFSAMPENAQKALSVGANDFMAKPLDVDDMVKRIEILLDRKA